MLRITGGKVYDPANGINGVVQDVCISDGRIVSDVEGGRTIDATGMVVFPGGVDIHTHVASGALNFARGLTPENMRAAAPFLHGPERRAGLGRRCSDYNRRIEATGLKQATGDGRAAVPPPI